MLSIWKMVATKLPALTQHYKEESKSYKLYQDLKSLPLGNFIECYCNNNLKSLIIEGDAPESILLSLWDNLYTQYAEIIGGDDLKENITKIWDIATISNRIDKISMLIEVINVSPTEGLFEQFYSFGYPLPVLPYNDINMRRIIKVISGYVKRDIAEIQRLQAIIESEDKVKNHNEEEFYKMIVSISDTFKIVINEATMSTMSFATYVNRYKIIAAEQEAKKSKLNNG